MRKRNSTIPCLFFFLLLIASGKISAQITQDSSVEEISNIEKKSFTRLLEGNGLAREQGYAGTVASNNFDVNFYRCEWEIDPNIRFIKGKITSYFTITSSDDKIVYDLSDTLTVDSITWHGNQILFQRTGNDGLQLQFPLILNAGQKDSVSIYYNGVPRNPVSFRPFVQSNHNGAPIIWTLSEPFGAKEWWPCKNGLNDKADSIDIVITNPAIYQAASNGVMVQESVDSNNNKTSYWKHRYPIASYLVAMAVSNYTVLKDSVMINGKPMNLVDYAYPEYAYYFDSQRPYTKFVLGLYSTLFGDYPFVKEKYGFTECNAGGGMEHQTNTFVNYPTIGLIPHETGHHWFGDKVTCGSWEDIWLNEGFATYCQVIYYERTDKNIFYQTLRNLLSNITSLPDGAVRVDDTTSASRIFSGRLSYNKGSYLLHMLRWKLGDDVFFRGLKRYLSDPLLQYNYAKTPDLKRNLELESGLDLTSFFQNWFYGQGYPSYAVQWTQDSSNNILVTLNQATSHSSVSFFDMPVPVEFKNAARDTIIVFDHRHNGQAFIFNPGFRADTAIFDPLLWLVSKNNTVTHAVCSDVIINDTIFPYYDIQWFQNSNYWTNITVNQTNKSATNITENIPLYIHFSGNGTDTSIELKNIRYSYSQWLNTGFKVTNIYISTSCLMDKNYMIKNLSGAGTINEIKIFPVPVSNNSITVSLKNPTDKQLTISLYNISGQLLYRKQINTPGYDELLTIPVNNISKGVYIIKVESESAIHLGKKIIR